MTTVRGLVLLMTMVGCGSAGRGTRVEVDATVQYLTIEGGFWALRGDDGVTYDPRTFPPDYRKMGLRVHASLNRLEDITGIHQVGPIVDVVQLVILPCGPVPCPAPPATVLLGVFDERGLAVPGAALVNVTGPPSLGTVTPTCSPGAFGAGPGADDTLCFIIGNDAGAYDADVTAPGFQTLHVHVDVPSRNVLPGECCPITYVPQRLAVVLRPTAP
jgi:hypothetical protein